MRPLSLAALNVALLVLIGVPVWIVVGLLIATLVSRRRSMAEPGVFVLKSRTSVDEAWPRRSAHGGVALVRTTVRGMTGVHERTDGPSAPLVATFDIEFDGGSVEQVTVDAVGAVPLRELAG